MFSIEYGQCATNHPAHCKLVINSIRQCWLWAGWISSQHVIFILLFKSLKLSRFSLDILQINVHALGSCVVCMEHVGFAEPLRTAPSFTPKLDTKVQNDGFFMLETFTIGLTLYPHSFMTSTSVLCLKQTEAFSESESLGCLSSLNFYLVWPVRSARVKDLTVHLLDIKAICWRLLPPQDIPLMCRLCAIHYRARKAPRQSN